MFHEDTEPTVDLPDHRAAVSEDIVEWLGKEGRGVLEKWGGSVS